MIPMMIWVMIMMTMVMISPVSHCAPCSPQRADRHFPHSARSDVRRLLQHLHHCTLYSVHHTIDQLECKMIISTWSAGGGGKSSRVLGGWTRRAAELFFMTQVNSWKSRVNKPGGGGGSGVLVASSRARPSSLLRGGGVLQRYTMSDICVEYQPFMIVFKRLINLIVLCWKLLAAAADPVLPLWGGHSANLKPGQQCHRRWCKSWSHFLGALSLSTCGSQRRSWTPGEHRGLGPSTKPLPQPPFSGSFQTLMVVVMLMVVLMEMIKMIMLMMMVIRPADRPRVPSGICRCSFKAPWGRFCWSF